MSDSNYDVVWDSFKGTCVLCYGAATSIHEIVPRSKIPATWMEIDNRVTLCNSCHHKVQDNPAAWEKKLIQARDYVLDVMGE